MSEDKIVDLDEKKKEKKETEEHREYCPICIQKDTITLYHAIRDDCLAALDESSLYIGDVLSTLERVKLELLEAQVEMRIENKLEKIGIKFKEEDEE
jgi:hypothetical protein